MSAVKYGPTHYGLSNPGVFFTIQGEGHLSGAQMVFVRLAGCSVGCPGCDTNYSLGRRVELGDLMRTIRDTSPPGWRDKWVWITGGEPTDHNLQPLIRALKAEGYSVAIATSGKRRVIEPVDWLSVSPHQGDEALVQRFGHELKVIPGLNGHGFEDYDYDSTDFMYYYAQPYHPTPGDPLTPMVHSRSECLNWVKDHPNWLLTEQAHKLWGVD